MSELLELSNEEILKIRDEFYNSEPNKKLLKELESFRKHIPERYTKLEFLDGLANPKVDWMVLISNRSDGKTFQMLECLINLSIKFKVGFTLVRRHYDLRKSAIEEIENVYEYSKLFKRKNLSFQRRDNYTLVYNKDQQIGIITELNSSIDFKQNNAVAKYFPIVWYDEFLAPKQNYVREEYEALKRIYETIDKNEMVGKKPYIGIPKLILTGNPENFDSELLMELNLFNKLESQEMKTLERYDNVILQMDRNDKANISRNTRAFKSENDGMITGKFKLNKYNIIDDQSKEVILRDGYNFFINLGERYLGVFYTFENGVYYSYVSVMSERIYSKYDSVYFCLRPEDITNETKLLKESFFNERFFKKYVNKKVQFDNQFSKSFILEDSIYSKINIIKCIKKHYYNLPKPTEIDKYNLLKMNNQKKNIQKRFFMNENTIIQRH